MTATMGTLYATAVYADRLHEAEQRRRGHVVGRTHSRSRLWGALGLLTARPARESSAALPGW